MVKICDILHFKFENQKYNFILELEIRNKLKNHIPEIIITKT
jgi:hypothetical protein